MSGRLPNLPPRSNTRPQRRSLTASALPGLILAFALTLPGLLLPTGTAQAEPIDVLAGTASATAPKKPAGKPLQRSVSCAACHREIFEEWQASAMARTVSLSRWCLEGSHEILDSIGRAEEMGERCYSCHAPGAYHRGAVPLEAQDESEGVGCDVCHAIADVDVSDPLGHPRITLEPGPKRGARPGVRADHEVIVSPLFASSQLCAGCHYFADPANGLPVDWTYAQWLASPHATRGETCQSCHMPRRPGRLSELPGSPMRQDVASHRFPGGRDLEMLRSALDLRLSIENVQGSRQAVIEIENVGAGHNVPGGGGGIRQLELRVEALDSDGKAKARLRRAYEIRYFTADGRQTSGSDPSAVRYEDSGIRAAEVRTERLVLPADTPLDHVRAELRYWYVSREAQARNQQNLPPEIAGPVDVTRRSVALSDAPRDAEGRRRPE